MRSRSQVIEPKVKLMKCKILWSLGAPLLALGMLALQGCYEGPGWGYGGGPYYSSAYGGPSYSGWWGWRNDIGRERWEAAHDAASARWEAAHNAASARWEAAHNAASARWEAKHDAASDRWAAHHQ